MFESVSVGLDFGEQKIFLSLPLFYFVSFSCCP